MNHRLAATTPLFAAPPDAAPAGGSLRGAGPVTPYIGQPVVYTLSKADADWINRRREDTKAFLASVRNAQAMPGQPGRDGHFLHVGSPVAEGYRLPAVVSAVYDPVTVNVRVELDGQDTYWATTRRMGTGPGTWSPPGTTVASRVASVGKPVHYVSYGSRLGEHPMACRAAVITEITGPGVASLCVTTPTGQFFDQDVPEDGGETLRTGFTRLCLGREYAGGSWHWPADA